ncbi:MAG TPA: Druantia anti-phage system protein DruA [Verrucomicrobiales bacterium]|nr:Druantia anti-phage system protein DruA [Verrucomicrobiales bacterium]
MAEADGRWVGLLAFSGAAPHLKGREKWIGWSPRQRARRLALVVNNSRFLLLVERRASRPRHAAGAACTHRQGGAPAPGARVRTSARPKQKRTPRFNSDETALGAGVAIRNVDIRKSLGQVKEVPLTFWAPAGAGASTGLRSQPQTQPCQCRFLAKSCEESQIWRRLPSRESLSIGSPFTSAVSNGW